MPFAAVRENARRFFHQAAMLPSGTIDTTRNRCRAAASAGRRLMRSIPGSVYGRVSASASRRPVTAKRRRVGYAIIRQ
jgi:hypothetical protein